MHIRAEALILSVRTHGEHGAIVRGLTRAHGVQPGYVRGGRSRRIRPILQPANQVLGDWRARTDEQLPQLSVELIRSRAPLFGEALPAAALHWVTALTASALPEGQAYTMLYDALAGVIGAIESAPAARGWAVALARYELLVLAELGFGLDLSHCVVTGAVEDLAWVSPKSGAAVSQSVGIGYRDKLLPLPAFLHAGGAADWPDILAGLAITGHFIARDVLTDRLADVLAARAQLLDRLKRAVA